MAKIIPPDEEFRLFGGKMPPPGSQNPDFNEQKQAGPKSQGLFSKKPDVPSPMPAFNQEFIELTRRMRMIEGNYSNLRRRIQLFEQNMILNDKKLHDDIRLTNGDIDELRRELHEIKQNMHLIIKELENTVRLEDYKVLQRYIEMWKPIKFVTHDEVLKIIDEKLSRFEYERNE